MPEATIDRRALVERHRVVQREPDPRSPLSVGNGEFCFTADLTGLQTFPSAYPVESQDQDKTDGTLLGTYTQWGWHTEPVDPEPLLAETLVSYAAPRGPVDYVDLTAPIDGGAPDGANVVARQPPSAAPRVARVCRARAIGVEPWTIRTDHPSMLCALGMLPQTTMIDAATMSAMLENVLADWD
ncbi:MAG TPA: hypothetical protein VHX59_14780 [Mycobacteriales bacterium]|jgi:hypothetical protein|nr:hypothetical protein [Mycobacteriales bacterium]